jgi:hypothetical protein
MVQPAIGRDGNDGLPPIARASDEVITDSPSDAMYGLDVSVLL